MNQFSKTPAIVLFFLLCAGLAHAQSSKAKSKPDKSSAQNLPYTALYSSQFEISDPSFSAIVLKAWKVYDDNTLDDAAPMIADTIHATLGNGMDVNGKDSFLNALKSYRGGFSAVKSEVIAYMSVKSTDKKDHLVLIWGKESDTRADGSVDKVDLHEVWGFNKDGKVDFFKQFASAIPK